MLTGEAAGHYPTLRFGSVLSRPRGLQQFGVGGLSRSWLFPLGSMAHVFSFSLPRFFLLFCHFPSLVLACENVVPTVLVCAAYGEMCIFSPFTNEVVGQLRQV